MGDIEFRSGDDVVRFRPAEAVDWGAIIANAVFDLSSLIWWIGSREKVVG